MTDLAIEPLTAERWPDLVTLFAASPVMRGCWCLWPHTPRGRMQVGPENELRMKAIVEDGTVPGLLAYADGVPAGWCSVGPRTHYSRFFYDHSDRAIWLLACMFISADHRGQRIGAALIEAAVAYAATHGAARLEALPRGWRPDDDPATMVAVLRLFHHAGFIDQAASAPARLAKDLERAWTELRTRQR